MTTPGQQLTPGDDQNPPEFGVPEGAYVGTAGQSNSITDLNNLTEAEAKNRMKSSVAGPFGRQRDGVWGFFSLITGVVQGVVDVVVGGVTAVVDGISQIFNAVGSLFGAARVDTAAVDAARVAGENAIVANMGEALDQLDEIQRVGGAYGHWGMFNLNWGEDHPHPIPLTRPFGEPPYALMQGVAWHPPAVAWNYSNGHTLADSDAARGSLAQRSGILELQESGLWMIYFQAALLQGTQRTATPADLWCYVTSYGGNCPVGTPPATGVMDAYYYGSGLKTITSVTEIAAYGRAGQYLGVSDTRHGGGNTVSGYMLCALPTPGWFIHLAGTGFRHFGGAASTMVFATKVNSESLRDDIEGLKNQIASALPGQSTDQLLDEASIAAMVAEAASLEVPEVVVPTDPPEAGNG